MPANRYPFFLFLNSHLKPSMNIVLFTTAVIAASLHGPCHQDSVQPVHTVNSLVRAGRLRQFAAAHVFAAGATGRIALTGMYDNKPVNNASLHLTGANGKTNMGVKTGTLPVQLCMSVSGIRLMRVRLKYVHTIF